MTFISETPETVIKAYWNKYEHTLSQLKSLLKNNNHFINIILESIGYNNIFEFYNTNNSIISSLYLPKTITNDFLKSNFHFKNEFDNRGVEIFKRIFNNFFKTNVFEIERKGKYPAKIIHPKTKKQINKWKINQDFFIAIDNYIKFSVAYNKTQECLIVNDECEIEDDIDSIDG